MPVVVTKRDAVIDHTYAAAIASDAADDLAIAAVTRTRRQLAISDDPSHRNNLIVVVHWLDVFIAQGDRAQLRGSACSSNSESLWTGPVSSVASWWTTPTAPRPSQRCFLKPCDRLGHTLKPSTAPDRVRRESCKANGHEPD